MNEGTFHESLNLAALWKLPVVFFCENNQYAMGTSLQRSSAVPEIYKRAEAYAMPSQQVDGMDVDAVFRATQEAVDRARRGGGPTLIEAITYRYKGHSMADAVTYRSREEEAVWRPRDPLTLFRERLLREGVSEETLLALEAQADAVVADAVTFADESAEPTIEDMYRFVYAA